MEDERRRYLRDVLDELDRYFDEFERSIEDIVRDNLGSWQQQQGRNLSRPVVAGFAMGLGPEGKPTLQFFGDRMVGPDGYRTPIYEQVVDEGEGRLRLLVELPGVEKDEIEVSALDETVSLKVERADRKYRADIELKRAVDPDTCKATYRNGLLEILFSVRDKTNKGYRRVRVV